MHGVYWIGFQSPPLLEREGGKKNLQIESDEVKLISVDHVHNNFAEHLFEQL